MFTPSGINFCRFNIFSATTSGLGGIFLPMFFIIIEIETVFIVLVDMSVSVYGSVLIIILQKLHIKDSTIQ